MSNPPQTRRVFPGSLAPRLGDLLAVGSREQLLVLALVLASLLLHGLNMFHYPAFTIMDDEGIYAAQAWAILREGRLAPYTYTYDHAPGGWMMLAAWLWASGGLDTFGSVIDSGRVLMLLLHLAMVPMLYRLARHFGAGPAAAALGTLLFSLSPLAIFYQRMVLLDNMALFWVLLSLSLITDEQGRLSRIALSGICFAIALMVKETAIFVAPAMLLMAWQHRREHHSRFAVSGWLLAVAVIVSWYPLFALLKGELFPSAPFAAPHEDFDSTGVSLIGALLWQSTRDGGGLLNLNNQFWQSLRIDWLPRDPLLFVGGALACFVNLFRGLRQRRLLTVSLLGLLPLAYLARGGVVFDYYVLFVIPFFCLNIALVIAPLLNRLPARIAAALGTITVAALGFSYWSAGTIQPLYLEHPDEPGREAVLWIKQHLDPSSKIIMRDDLWTYMHEPGMGGPAFPNAHNHWKVGQDPEIRIGVFGNDWRNVDYIIWSPGLENALESSNNTLALEAMANAHLVRRWIAGKGDRTLHEHQIIELYKVNRASPSDYARLDQGRRYLQTRFEQNGAFVNAEGSVVSESQAYAMLRAVWSNDRAAFERAWTWTRDNLRNEQGLLAWHWREGQILDANPASDADTDAALALLLAGRRWNDPALIAEGRAMAQAIWRHEVVSVGGKPYLTAGSWATQGEVLALNPSYFAPYAYEIFAEVDPDNNWRGLVESSYEVLFTSSSMTLRGAAAAGLPPDWIGLERATGELVPLELERGDTTSYGYDAARTFWRIALHERWSRDERATQFLNQAHLLRDEIARRKAVSAVYRHDGAVIEPTSSMVASAGALAALLTHNPILADQFYATAFSATAESAPEGMFWINPDDLYAQEWGWFATALYAEATPNLWRASVEGASND